MTTRAFKKKASDFIPFAADQGLPHLAGAALAGVSVIPLLITQSGAAPLVVDLEAEIGMKMANTNYVVICDGETAADTEVDESTKTLTGFNVLGGADTEVHNILVVGQLAGQTGPND